MTTLLEDRYRWWLRLLPAWYRAEREEEMIATLSEGAGPGEDAELGRPSWAEIRGVLALAVRTRLGGLSAAPRAYAWGEAARLFALAAVLMQAILAATAMLTAAYGYFLSRGSERARWQEIFGPPFTRATLVNTGQTLLPAVWIAVYLAVVFGYRRTARWLALTAAVYAIYRLHRPGDFGSLTNFLRFDAFAMAVLLGVLPALATMTAFHQDAPPIARKALTIALPAGVALIWPWEHFAEHSLAASNSRPDEPGIYSWLLAAAAGGYAIMRRVTGRPREAGWPLGLALMAGSILTVRVSALVLYLQELHVGRPAGLVAMITVAAVQTAVVGLTALLLLIVAIRALRQLPAHHRDPGIKQQ